ncbi:MAG: histone deacetylase superfamily [Acidobacteriales bacterium]|nr:histone deacetylase superfamily [Terriglobales bacterium]
MSRRLFYCDDHVIPLPPGHKFPITKYRLIRDLLKADGLFELCPAQFAERATIELVHEEQYVDEFFRGTLPDAAIRRIGFPWSEGLVRRTLASVGGTLSATQDALEFGWGGNLAGGTHHAFRAAGSGFCVFNDLAIAIHWLRRQGKISRAAIIDLDVHQGDGTAEIFTGDTNVLTASVHCKSNFPFRKQQSSIDVDLRDGTTDEEYLCELDMLLPQVFAFEPEIIFYQSGVDGLQSDSIGRLALSHQGLKERDRRVMSAAKCHRVPLVVTLGGGYSIPIELTAKAHANTYRTAAEVFS